MNITESKELGFMRYFLKDSGLAHRVTSAVRIGATARHWFPGTSGMGLALDISGPSYGRDTDEQLALFNMLFKTIGHQLRELYFSHPSVSLMIRKGRVVPRSQIPKSIIDGHHDHVHWSVVKGTFVKFPIPTTFPEASQMIRNEAIAIRPTPSGQGFYIAARDGGVFPFGDAIGFGSLYDHIQHTAVDDELADLAVTSTGKGYWLLSNDGGVFPYGDAVGYGSAYDQIGGKW